MRALAPFLGDYLLPFYVGLSERIEDEFEFIWLRYFIWEAVLGFLVGEHSRRENRVYG